MPRTNYTHDRMLKPESQEDVKLAETINGKRALIRRYGWHDNLVHRILTLAEREGWSGEDTMTMIAYHALLEREEMREMLVNHAMTTPAKHIHIQSRPVEGRSK